MKYAHSLFGEARLIAFDGGAEIHPKLEKLENREENPIDELMSRLQSILDQANGVRAPQEQAQVNQAVEGFNNELTDIRGGVFEELQSQGLLQSLNQQFQYNPMGGNLPYENNGYQFDWQNGRWGDPTFGSYASAFGPMRPWESRTALMYPTKDNMPVRIFDMRGPYSGNAAVTSPLEEYIYGGNSYPEVDDMLDKAREARVAFVRKTIRQRLDDAKAALGFKKGEKKEDTNNKKPEGSTEIKPDEKIDASKMTPEQKAQKRKELEKKQAPLKDEEAKLRAAVKGKPTNEMTAERERLKQVVDELMGIAAQMQALEGDKNNPDGKANQK